jgi:nicotinate-nucleotide adenylyltransferase
MKHNESSHQRPARVGLFGGTFNPVHQGHLTAARDVLYQLNLDRIYFVPSALPPHKSNDQLVPARQRLEMVSLAVGESNRFCVCDIEIQRTGPSYSIDTVRQFRANTSVGGQLFFVLGMDAFLEIHTWKTFEALFYETACAVMSRPGTGQWTPQMRDYIQDYVANHISSAYRLSDQGDRLIHSRMKTIYLLTVTPVDISSSRLRAMIQAGQSIDAWVCPSVARYIEIQGLYR